MSSGTDADCANHQSDDVRPQLPHEMRPTTVVEIFVSRVISLIDRQAKKNLEQMTMMEKIAMMEKMEKMDKMMQ